MDGRYLRLLEAVRSGIDTPPAELRTAVACLPDAGQLPSPWEAWVLIGLVRHHARQQWVLDLVRTRLRGDATQLAMMGSLGHPEDVPQSGPVPGSPEWEYYFHWRGCCVSHKVRGDAIDVDFFDDTADYFDTYFYVRFLKSLRQPEPPEARILGLHPSVRPVAIAFTDLTSAGALVQGGDPERPRPPRLPAEVLDYAEDVERFCDLWGDPTRRLWLAAVIGDWPAAHELATPELAEGTAGRADACRRQRHEHLRAVTGFPASDALHGLDDLGVADQYLAEAFQGPPSGQISAALEIAERQPDSRWWPHIYALFRRVDPTAQPPQPHIWLTSLKLLVRHGYKAGELIAELGNAGGTAIGEAVLLALEFAPRNTIPLVRKGLLSHIPINRIEVAAILAIIRKGWSTRELLNALKECDQETTAEARAALLELGDPEADRAVLDWEQKNPHEDEVGSYLEVDGRKLGPFYTFGELALKNCGSRIRHEMDQLHDRVMKLRDVAPPEPTPDRPWWKFWGG